MWSGGTPARAQTWPSKPVRLIVGFEAGGGTDTLARLIAPPLSAMWGEPVVVENRPGADGSIAAALVAWANPDGLMIAAITNAHTITPSEHHLSYDPVKSFAPITELAFVPDILLVNPALPVHSVTELVALAKAKPGALNYGSAGTGTSPYLEMRLFESLAGIQMVHVPFKGSAPATTALLSGELQLMFGSISTTLNQVRAGKLRALAVSTKVHSPTAPEIPTMAEAAGLPDFDSGVWYGLLAPAHTPTAITEKISHDIGTVLLQPDMQKRLVELGFITVADSPQHFTATIEHDIARWSKFVDKPAAQ
jgi:tripartite-type tricarboxylate transporter receptor subunit TctC